MLLPFKAYTVIAPVLFLISSGLPRPPHVGASEAEAFLIVSLFPCSILLLFAALILAIVGPKGSASPCFWFGVAGFAIAYSFLPSLANA